MASKPKDAPKKPKVEPEAAEATTREPETLHIGLDVTEVYEKGYDEGREDGIADTTALQRSLFAIIPPGFTVSITAPAATMQPLGYAVGSLDLAGLLKDGPR